MHRRAAWPVKSSRGVEVEEKCGVTAIVGKIINAEKKLIQQDIFHLTIVSGGTLDG